MKLSKNFSLKEMTASQTAERKGINNNPNDDQITALQNYVRIYYNQLEITMLHQ